MLRSHGSRPGPLLLLAAAASLAVAACGGTSTKAGNQTPDSELSAYVIATTFPADAADWSKGQSLGAFIIAVRDEKVAACMKADAFPPPPPTMNEFSPENEDFPDLNEIARTGSFIGPSIPSPRNPTRGMGKAEQKAYQRALTLCNRSSRVTIFHRTLRATVSLANEWSDKLARIDATPQVQAKMRQFDSCVGGMNGSGTNSSAFFGNIDQKTIPIIAKYGRKAAQPEFRRLARLFVRCFTPVESLRVRLRLTARRTFFAANSEQIAALRRDADTTIVDLENRFGTHLVRRVRPQS